MSAGPCRPSTYLLTACVCLLAALLFAERALVIDYELNPPDCSNELIRRVAASGFTVDHRQDYPHHDGYWLNRYTWLVDDGTGRLSIEVPHGTQREAWEALSEGNRLLDQYRLEDRPR